MGALIGFIVGYYLGTQDGRERLGELRESLDTIRNSPEVQGMFASGASAVTGLAQEVLAEKGSLRNRLVRVAGGATKDLIDRRAKAA
jgi:hypothetical protein